MEYKRNSQETLELINEKNIRDSVAILMDLFKSTHAGKNVLKEKMFRIDKNLGNLIMREIQQIIKIIEETINSGNNANDKPKIVEKSIKKILESMLRMELNEPKSSDGHPAKTKTEFYNKSLAAKLNNLNNEEKNRFLPNPKQEYTLTLVQLKDALTQELSFLSLSQTKKADDLAA